MTLWLFLEYVIGFTAPAVVVALILSLGMKLRPAGRWGAATGMSVLVAGGVIVLLAGLVLFGRDGRIATYGALVLVQGMLAWWLRGR